MRVRVTLALYIVFIVAFAAAANAKWRGFKYQQLVGNQYAVSYTPKTISAKVPNIMLFLMGNTGRICLEKGFRHAKLEKIDVGDKYQGIKQVSTTVEFFKEPTEDSESCEELAIKPTNPKELKQYRRKHPEG